MAHRCLARFLLGEMHGRAGCAKMARKYSKMLTYEENNGIICHVCIIDTCGRKIWPDDGNIVKRVANSVIEQPGEER